MLSASKMTKMNIGRSGNVNERSAGKLEHSEGVKIARLLLSTVKVSTLMKLPSLQDVSVPSVRGILVSRYLYKKIDGERRIAVARTKASQEIIKFDFQAGQAVSREELVNKLSAQGYERVNRISAQGQFAVLGGIIDIHQWGEDRGLRLDFFGDTIDAISDLTIGSKVAGISQRLQPPLTSEL